MDEREIAEYQIALMHFETCIALRLSIEKTGIREDPKH
jgi:hypothetical protein